MNCSPPNADTHGLIPPDPSAIKIKPMIVNSLERNDMKATIPKLDFNDLYFAGNPNDSIAPIETTVLPIAYTIDK